jgi:type 1 glutamine amidotransferase/nicotinamidase-related amidase
LIHRLILFLAMSVSPPALADEDSFALTLRSREALDPQMSLFASKWQDANWKARETAIIICDMWDSHHSVTAVRRVNEFAPRLNEVLKTARTRGSVIIHSPSDCMDAYTDHPARANALSAPATENPPADVAAWCHRIPAEEAALYPIDQSDGGEDEDAFENAQWAAQLEAEGRKPGTPWLKQTPLLEISTADYIAAEGNIVWNVLKDRGIKHVILTGVHTNMCVLGRPFGLRQMVRLGMETVLMRDCTDVMYNPKRWPFVSHFTGIDLVVNHIEQFVCPTITSNQIVGGEPFRFTQDKRPHLVMLIGEQEYETLHSLPRFEKDHRLGKKFSVSYVIANKHEGEERNHFYGGEHLDDADVVLVSIRRRAMAANLMRKLRDHISAGKPVIGVRTASHAFAPADPPQNGYEVWPTFDADVFGGNYAGHHGNKGPDAPISWTWVADSASDHPVTTGIDKGEWKTDSWLYKTSPLKAGAHVLLMGRVVGREPSEPVAWTFVRPDGGRSFYTSLGHPDDFMQSPKFQRLLWNAIHWAGGIEVLEKMPLTEVNHQGWARINPGPQFLYSKGEDGVGKFVQILHRATGWDELAYFFNSDRRTADEANRREGGAHLQCARTLLRVPTDAPTRERVFQWMSGASAEVFLNGSPLVKKSAGQWIVSKDALVPGDLNLMVLRASSDDWAINERDAPILVDGERSRSLAGKIGQWEFRDRAKNDKSDVTFPIPPQFGASTDQIQNWPE